MTANTAILEVLVLANAMAEEEPERFVRRMPAIRRALGMCGGPPTIAVQHFLDLLYAVDLYGRVADSRAPALCAALFDDGRRYSGAEFGIIARAIVKQNNADPSAFARDRLPRLRRALLLGPESPANAAIATLELLLIFPFKVVPGVLPELRAALEGDEASDAGPWCRSTLNSELAMALLGVPLWA